MNLENYINQAEFINIFWQIGVTFSFILADIISGFISALILKKLDSQKMREGLLRKILLIIVIALSFILQYGLFNIGLISKSVCVYIIIMEIVSIFENLKKAGIDLRSFR